MSGVELEVQAGGAEDVKKQLAAINKQLAIMVKQNRSVNDATKEISKSPYLKLNEDIKKTTRSTKKFGQEGVKAGKAVNSETEKLAKKMSSLLTAINAAAAAYAGFAASKGMVSAGDAVVKMNNAIRVSIDDTKYLVKRQKELYEVSKRSRAELTSTVGT